MFLHETGSTSLLYCHGEYDKVYFHPYFMVKDRLNFVVWGWFYFLILRYPFNLGDKEIFIEANSIVRPVHIVPEWYFLFAYAILRSIPNKLLGVVALVISIIIFYYLTVWVNYITPLDEINNYSVVLFFFICVILTWVGQCRVEIPFIVVGQVASCIYFAIVLALRHMSLLNN